MSRDTFEKKSNKMWFLQFLRGVACLLIVYVHWLTFLLSPASVNDLVFQSALPAYETPMAIVAFANAVNRVLPFDFREVYFGLALFFIISGFIIPVSLEKGSKANYVIRRVARILPTAIVCTVVTSLVILVGRLLEGNAVAPFSITAVIANAILVRDVVGQPFIDTAIWTLEVEVHFYLICFVIGFFSGQKKALVILGMALAFLLASMALSHSTGPYESYKPFLNLIAMNGSFLALMFVGMALYNFNAGNWSVLKTVLVVFLLMVMNNLTLQNYASTTAGIMYVNHVYAVLVFIVLLLLGEKVPYFKGMDKLADVSYPLYLLHGSCGYTIFYIAYKEAHNTIFALTISLVTVLALTLIVHRTIELPSTPAGKWVARFVDERGFFEWFKRRAT